MIDYEINGSDALVTYQYYLNNTDSYIDYFGRSNEIILPLIISFIKISNLNLTIDHFSFIINSLIVLTVYFALSRIIKLCSVYEKSWWLLIFFSIFEYGTSLQLMRQSLGVALFLIGISFQGLMRIIFYAISAFTHTASLAPIILYEYHSRAQKISPNLLKFSIVQLALISLLPFFIFKFWNPHISLVSDEYFINLKIRDYLYLTVGIFCLFSINKKLKSVSFIILYYYFIALFYSFFGIFPLFERMFLFFNLVAMPLIVAYYIIYINKYFQFNIKIIIFLLLNTLILLNIFIKQ